ncbi:MAG: DNA (cytosine-5-)-methyltransferase [Fimbriimonadales bacterium]|nr:MAG: DNA (cytosine-5-)-methyltransferase [Fimbriimonadales bacterium]
MRLEYTCAEYFAGIGLMRMGLEAEGWRVVFANDISPHKFAMYQGFFPDDSSHYIVDDIFSLDVRAIPKATLATCSFPCIDLSLAGNMRGLSGGKHSSAFWGFVRLLHAQRDDAPPILLLENVNGWLYSNRGEDFRLTILSLNELGYACDVFTLDALRFMPQSRPRVFVVATRLPVGEYGYRRLLERPRGLLSERLRATLLANKDLRWYALPLPTLPPLLREGLSQIVEPLAEDDPRWWSEAETRRHLAMMSDSHRCYVEWLAQGERIVYRTFYRRRRPDGQRAEVRRDDIAGCLRTAVGGSGKQFLIRAGQGRIRMRTMTPREYARLQGVPDHMPISLPDTQALTAFGDAVCVPVVRWIARYVLAPLVEALPHPLTPLTLFEDDGG